MYQLEFIFDFLDFSDIVRSALVCRRFNISYIKYLTLRSDTWIIEQVDRYLSCRQILMAERILRYYICLNDISGNKFAYAKYKHILSDGVHPLHVSVKNRSSTIAARGPIDPQVADQILLNSAESHPVLCRKITTPIRQDSTTAVRGPIDPQVADQILLNSAESHPVLCGKITTPIRQDSTKIISKYIYMLSTYIWDNCWYNPTYRDHRTEIYKFLRKRVNNNLNDYNIYIPINLYSHKNSDSNLVYSSNLCKSNTDVPYSNSFNPNKNYVISLIFAYICIRDKQFELAKNIIISIENKKYNVIRQYNILYYLVKWHLTNNFGYLSVFKNSDFAFGLYIYGCKLHEHNISTSNRSDNTQFIKILYKCIELDPSFVNAINAIISTDNRFDLILSSIRSNPDHIPSYISNLSLLFEKLGNITTDRGPEHIRQDNIMYKILDSVEDFMISKNSLYPNHNTKELKFDKFTNFKHSLICVNIHYILSDQNLIVKNLVLLYRLYTHNCWLRNDMSTCRGDIRSLLLYIQNNFNLTPEYKKYIYDQLAFI